MATRFVFLPGSAEFPATLFPQFTYINRRPVLAFDAAADETAYWTFIAPQGMTGTLTILIHYMMASATTGSVYWEGILEAITPGDATDLDAGNSFGTTNSGNGAVPATAGYEQSISITLTNNDSIAVGDYVRLSINRDANHASDTATGDAYLLAVEFRDAA